MFGLFFHPRRSDDGRPVAVRVVAGAKSSATTDAPNPVLVERVAHDEEPPAPSRPRPPS